MHKFIIPLFALAFLLVSCNQNEPAPAPTEQTSSTPSVTSTSASADDKAPSIPATFDGKLLKGTHTVVLKTSKGDITIKLHANAAPKTVTNFIYLAKTGYFDGLTFHRIIPGFMVQGGDPNGDGTGGSSIFGDAFEDEINANSYGLQKKTLKDAAEGEPLPPDIADKTIKEYYESQGYTYNDELLSLPMVRGALAMANRGPNTNGSQFFIIHGKSTPWLEGKHTVFGMVIKGMDVVDAITNVQRDSKDKPLEPITYTVEVVN